MISLPSHLGDISFKHGYSFGPDEKDKIFSGVFNWKSRVLSRIDSVVSFYKPLTSNEKQVIESVIEATNFLENPINNLNGHISGMSVQLNVNSKLNQFIKKKLDWVSKFNIENIENFFKSVDSNIGHIFSINKKIFIGTDFFGENNESLTNDRINDIGLGRTVKGVIYHEATHAFEYTNRELYGNKFDALFGEVIYGLPSILSNNNPLREGITQLIEKNKHLGIPEIDEMFIDETRSVCIEIYADVGSVLLQRNQDILDGIHTKETDMLNIDSLMKGRNKEQFNLNNLVNSTSYVSIYNHLTSPGLDYLKSIYDMLPARALSQEEMHEISDLSVQRGVSRILLSNAAANNKNIGQLKLLFNLKIEPSVNFEDNKFSINEDMDLISKSFVDGMEQLKKFAGKEWVANFTNNLSLIKENKVLDYQRASWHAGINVEQFKKDLANNEANTKELNDLFDIEPIIKTIIVGDKNKVLNSMSKIRNNALEKNENTTQKKFN
ncbi:hypothetical protein GW820_04090 [archaeon]|nr:hypothetical protein [archaeon]